MHKKIRITAAALAAVLLTAAAATGCSFGGDLGKITDTTFCEGVIIGGMDLAGKTKEQAATLLSMREQKGKDFTINLTFGKKTYTYTEEDFAIESDYEAAVEYAYDFLFGGTARQYYERKYMLSTEPHEFGVGHYISQESLEKQIKALAKKLDRDPVEPKVISHNGKKFTFDNGKNGIKVNQKKTVAAIQAALKKSNDVTVEVVYKSQKPEAAAEDFAGIMKELGSFTTISTNNANGNKNMSLALDYVNGTTIGPGETFSFNDIIGDSTNDSRGFVPAGAIVNGKLVDAYGGGICQASTTIYGAALRSDLTITERHNHMWPSTYVEIGQDAAVDYGIQDFCFRNDSKYPIYIECGMDGTKLYCTIYGYQSPDYDTIEVTSEKTGTLKIPEPTFKVDKKLKKNEVKTDREARAGQTASAWRIYYKDGKKVKTEELHSSYYPSIGAIYRHAPKADLSKYKE